MDAVCRRNSLEFIDRRVSQRSDAERLQLIRLRTDDLRIVVTGSDPWQLQGLQIVTWFKVNLRNLNSFLLLHASSTNKAPRCDRYGACFILPRR